MVANDFEIPTKPPVKPSCGKCEGCKCKSAKQGAPKSWPKPSPQPLPLPRSVGVGSGNKVGGIIVFSFICGLAAGSVAGFLVGMIKLHNADVHAKCMSVGGQYGNSKCYLNGEEVK